MPPSRSLKRKHSDSETTLSHIEVYKLVREQKIHLAQELYTLAQSLSEGGDSRLLNYCTGEKGPKKTLQKSIDAVWKPSTEDAEGHLKALCGTKLQELQRRALRPSKTNRSNSNSIEVLDVCGGGLRSILETGVRRRGTKRIKNEGTLHLFDHFGRQAEIIFRPYLGVWRLRDFFEVLVACRQQDGLAATEPSPCAQGGIRLPRSEAGWKTMLATGVADQDKSFAKLSESELASCAGELRLCETCGPMPWQIPSTGVPKGAKKHNAWIYAMPKDASFHENTLYDRPEEEKVVRLWAKHHVEDQHLVAVLKAIEACQHEVVQTKGFGLKQNKLCVTGTKARRSSHKAGSTICFGLASAQAAVEDEKDAIRRKKNGLPPRAFLLTNGSSSDVKPELSRQYYLADRKSVV